MLLASSWDPQDSLDLAQGPHKGPPQELVWCEVEWSLLLAEAQCLLCHHSLHYSPSLTSHMERGGLVRRRAGPAEAFWALLGTC